MAKNEIKQTSNLKKILIVVGIIIGLPVAFVIISIALSPILDAIDHSKFNTLDQQSRAVFNTIKNASGGADDWKYQAGCEDDNAGFFGAPEYICNTILALDTTAVSATQIKTLHDKYYSVINHSPDIKPTDVLNEQLASQFGSSFVISSAERHYKTSGGLGCTYIAQVAQIHENTTYGDTSYGAPINGGIARVLITFSCGDMARGNWYGL